MEFITLKVEGIEIKDGRYVIKSGGKSYSFFEKKKDGSASRAFQDFVKLGVKLGDYYSFGVSESQGTANDGKPITYKNIGVIGAPQDFPQPTPPTDYPQQTVPQQTVPQNNPQPTNDAPDFLSPDTTADVETEFVPGQVTRAEFTQLSDRVSALELANIPKVEQDEMIPPPDFNEYK